ncbi:protein tyrosine phosphatase [Pseudarthrobacter sp. AB1]|uniref:protein tyrosine phosphatase n=1 Tax=Pseudarthrobacter sp. AB1 TaxID=2138309 RepID=UPI00186B68BC|nr:protein tyrosine phosphatase [Pseudarthrobacter sp. AB1]MBE4718968.1 protein tyrosine phosphatase [Pseudarthrobacter sp. AB1]
MSFFTALVTSKIAAGILAGGTLAAGGAATAAYTGTLPAPLQQASHEVTGAPAPAAASTAAEHTPAAARHGKASKAAAAPAPRPDATPVGPDATGPAAFGLCTAFTNGGLDPASTAFESLATAANGGAGIAAYCKSVPAPGQAADHREDKPANSGTSLSPGKGTPPAQADKGLSHKPATAGKP